VPIPARPGTYVLLMAATQRRRLTIGRLGALAVREGCYCYVGSARGPGGLRARLRHHLGTARRLHWHIDYLRRAARPVAAWFSDDPSCSEHAWADILRAMPGASIPLRRFGASDCKCNSHLFWFATPPDFTEFARRLPPARRQRQLVQLSDLAHNQGQEDI
jgi:Uri superfamily endonuclease